MEFCIVVLEIGHPDYDGSNRCRVQGLKNQGLNLSFSLLIPQQPTQLLYLYTRTFTEGQEEGPYSSRKSDRTGSAGFNPASIERRLSQLQSISFHHAGSTPSHKGGPLLHPTPPPPTPLSEKNISTLGKSPLRPGHRAMWYHARPSGWSIP